MAAVRRGSDSGYIVAMVICVVVAIVSVIGLIWSYQQLSLARKAIADNQNQFGSAVGSVFSKNGWELTAQTPTELGVKYSGESFADVAAKLEMAAEYEKAVLPLVGWQSLDGIQAALADSPLQKEAEAQGAGAFATVQGLLASYEEKYIALTGKVATLEAETGNLSKQLADTKQTLLQTEQQLRGEMNAAAQQFRDDLAKLRQDYNDIVAQHDEQQRQAGQWRQKYQEEVNTRERMASDLQDRITKLRRELEVAIAGPGEKERMKAKGRVRVVQPEFEFVVIEGGRDKGVTEDSRMVVYEMTPDGRERMKAIIQVGQVKEYTSVAIVSRADDTIFEGDYFVPVALWQQFHGDTD